jgi:hypothetical protein
MVQYLISSNILFRDSDYKIKYADRVIQTYMQDGVWQKREIIFEKPQDVLFLSLTRVFGLYKSHVLKEGDKPLPKATIEYYIINNPAFICDTKKESFKKVDAKTGCQVLHPNGKGVFTCTTAFIFYFEKLGLSMEQEGLVD